MSASSATQPLGRSAGGAVAAASDTVALGGKRATAVDSLALGMVFALSAVVLQRLVGFVRGILFCRFLPDDQLGQWSLAFSFMLLFAPLTVLGLPGSFGRYVEFYRSRGTLRSFLRRTTLVTALLAVVGIAALALGRDWFGWLIFNDVGQGSLVLLLALVLVGVVSFNFLTELLTALRKVRWVSYMQFASSIVFAVVGIGLVAGTTLGIKGVVIAYGASCLLPAVCVMPFMWGIWRELPTGPTLRGSALWSKLVPFAAWVWVINIMTNMFDAADRYMILHFAPLPAGAAQSMVGQYHSSRIVPLLMVGAATMIAGVLLPYLSHEWEAGRRGEVSHRVNLAIKIVALSFTAGAAAILLLSPILFGWVLAGRYDAGLSVLPLTLVYCVWFSLFLVANTYLWCDEKASLGSAALLVGVLGNIGLNLVLVPTLGLQGAVIATAAANAITLSLLYVLCRRRKMRLTVGTLLVTLLPLVLLLGAWQAAVLALAVAVVAATGSWLFDAREKELIGGMLARFGEKARSCFGRSA